MVSTRFKPEPAPLGGAEDPGVGPTPLRRSPVCCGLGTGVCLGVDCGTTLGEPRDVGFPRGFERLSRVAEETSFWLDRGNDDGRDRRTATPDGSVEASFPLKCCPDGSRGVARSVCGVLDRSLEVDALEVDALGADALGAGDGGIGSTERGSSRTRGKGVVPIIGEPACLELRSVGIILDCDD